MDSLKLLCQSYQSDDENEDTDPDGSNQPQENHVTENIPELPLPESILNLYVTPTEVEDNAELHNGRVRSFPHERGNWVTSVYISCKYFKMKRDDSKQLSLICDTLIKNCEEIINFFSCEDFHISLSRTVILRHHWIDLFVEDLKKRSRNVKSFYVDVKKLAIFVNEENTRTFVGLEVQHGHDELINCVKLVDDSLLEFKLSTFYEDPAFHVSLLWCLGNKRKEIQNILPTLQAYLDHSNSTKSTLIHVNQISCKIGNRFYKFALK